MRRLRQTLLFLLLLFLPTQLGIHFWPTTSIILGRRIDYLSPTLYFFDILFGCWAISLFWTKPPYDLAYLSLDKMVRGSKWWKSHHYRLFKNFINQPLKFFMPISLLVISFNTIWQHHLSPVGIYFVFRLWQAAALVLLLKKIRPQLKDILFPLSLGSIFIVILAVSQFMRQGSLGGLFYFLGERTFDSLTPNIAQTVVGGRLLLRPYATFSHPNTLGGYLTIILAALLFVPKTFWSKLNPSGYLLHQAAIVATVLGIGLSFSRTAWVVASGLLVIRSWQYKKELGQKVMIVALLILAIEELFLGRIVPNLFLYPESLWQRKNLFWAAAKLFLLHPFWGVGLGNFIPKLAVFRLAYSLLQPVHSIYLLWLVETGLIGASLVVYLMIKLLKTVLKTQNHILWAVLVSGLILGLFDHYLLTQPQTRNLWLILLVSLSV